MTQHFSSRQPAAPSAAPGRIVHAPSGAGETAISRAGSSSGGTLDLGAWRTEQPAQFGLQRLVWMVLAIAAANFIFLQIAQRMFGKIGFASVPIVRAGTTGTTLALLVAWWLISNPWNGRFAVSRRAGILALLLVVWLCLGLYYAAPLGYIASDTFFLFHGIVFLFVFHTYFRREDYSEARHPGLRAGPFDRWLPTPLWLIAIGVAGFYFPELQLPPSVALVIVVGAVGSLIAGRYSIAVLLGGLLTMIYATTGNRAFLFAVIITLICGLYISRRTRALKVILALAFFAEVFSASSDLTGLTTSRQQSRVTEAWDSFVSVANGGRIEELPVPLYQRVYEAQLVTRRISDGGIVPFLFGYGAGASLDMSGSIDVSVAEASLLGLEHVHNIHLLPFMVMYRYGLLGLLLLAALIAGMIRQLVRFRRVYIRDGTHLGAALAVTYVLAWLGFAFPAGGFIFENPLMFVCIAAVWAAGKPAYGAAD